MCVITMPTILYCHEVSVALVAVVEGMQHYTTATVFPWCACLKEQCDEGSLWTSQLLLNS